MVITSDSLRDERSGNTATISATGVQITTAQGTFQSEYFKNPASVTFDVNGNEVDRNPINLLGSGDLRGFIFNINGNCEGTSGVGNTQGSTGSLSMAAHGGKT